MWLSLVCLNHDSQSSLFIENQEIEMYCWKPGKLEHHPILTVRVAAGIVLRQLWQRECTGPFGGQKQRQSTEKIGQMKESKSAEGCRCHQTIQSYLWMSPVQLSLQCWNDMNSPAPARRKTFVLYSCCQPGDLQLQAESAAWLFQ